jgi:integrase
MTVRKGNPDQYLQKIGNTYYARVRVPRTLEKYVGQTHIRQSLKTGDRVEANRRKHAVVGRIKQTLAELSSNPAKTQQLPGISYSDSRAWREDLMKAEEAGDHDLHGVILDHVIEKAKEIERLNGEARASKWFKSATRTNETLTDLLDRWLDSTDYKESTKEGHRKALRDLLSYLEDEDATPADVTRKTAIAYIDNDLTQKGYAHTTIRDRLASFVGFWRWLEGRAEVPPNLNPWTSHRVSKEKNKGSTPPKRSYSDDELLKLLEGTPATRGWPTYAYLPDLMILGLYSGARIDELCSLTADDVDCHESHCFITIKMSKTRAGERPVAFTHPAPIAVLKRRMEGRVSGQGVFPELSPGGIDDKLSASAVKAYGRYRRACGVPDGTDFHSFRRLVITTLEHASVDQVSIARFVGHKIGTMAGDTYSDKISKDMALKTSRNIRYTEKVEQAVLALLPKE